MSSSAPGLLVSLGAVGVYSYAFYSLGQPKVTAGFANFLPKALHAYGIFKFLTIQCLLIQLVSSLLHVLAHFVKPLRGLRDLVFSTLAFPVGSLVVYTFWLVWFGMGRELIFPKHLDEFYPPWLNHATHTIIVPINFLLAVAVNHKYSKSAVLLTLVYLLGYTIFLHVVKAQTGLFIYGYLNELKDTERLVYFGATAVFAYLLYKLGQLVSHLAHGRQQVAQKKSSKKQR